jgi:hypothetical protein
LLELGIDAAVVGGPPDEFGRGIEAVIVVIAGERGAETIVEIHFVVMVACRNLQRQGRRERKGILRIKPFIRIDRVKLDLEFRRAQVDADRHGRYPTGLKRQAGKNVVGREARRGPVKRISHDETVVVAE